MASRPHRSLWPETLEAVPGFDFDQFLKDQAADLKKLVKKSLDVAVERRVVDALIAYSFVLVLRKQDYRYQLFSIRTIDGDFPARIVAPHMPEPLQVIPVSDANELISRLSEIFHHPNTIKIITTLRSEASEEANS
jgi:hypothetical protein